MRSLARAAQGDRRVELNELCPKAAGCPYGVPWVEPEST